MGLGGTWVIGILGAVLLGVYGLAVMGVLCWAIGLDAISLLSFLVTLRDRRRAALEQRERMARDVHDLLGHSLTVANLQLQLAERLFDSAPERARAELARTLALGWVLRETATNVLRHAHATRVEIFFAPGSSRWSTTATDTRGATALPGCGSEWPRPAMSSAAAHPRSGVSRWWRCGDQDIARRRPAVQRPQPLTAGEQEVLRLAREGNPSRGWPGNCSCPRGRCATTSPTPSARQARPTVEAARIATERGWL